MGSLEARRVAEGDRTSFWQAVIVDLFFGGSAWWDSSCPAASLQAGIDARGPRGDFQRRVTTRQDIAAMDLFVVPTIGFDLLYAFVIIRLDRRDLVWINVTANPTAEWVARQITEAFPWDEAPRHLIRDRDRIYGSVVTRRLRAMGIRDKPTPASPWQNGFAD